MYKCFRILGLSAIENHPWPVRCPGLSPPYPKEGIVVVSSFWGLFYAQSAYDCIASALQPTEMMNGEWRVAI